MPRDQRVVKTAKNLVTYSSGSHLKARSALLLRCSSLRDNKQELNEHRSPVDEPRGEGGTDRESERERERRGVGPSQLVRLGLASSPLSSAQSAFAAVQPRGENFHAGEDQAAPRAAGRRSRRRDAAAPPGSGSPDVAESSFSTGAVLRRARASATPGVQVNAGARSSNSGELAMMCVMCGVAQVKIPRQQN